ncbi:hypothetical protein OE88DRAFT_1662934 [Heliocybe sulcata]|uniref:RING-type domain-containing protein n=1 Tax=Heliocybe sulcata TaxID=5364 RepID=A0A5C3MWY2_9AGAM|nr:hypothetical protein OE88DRAFT_1662934 [Heliocybe sulcata]
MVYCNGPFCTNKWFADHAGLQQHMWGSPRHSHCKACKRGFVDKRALLSHKESVHSSYSKSKRSSGYYSGYLLSSASHYSSNAGIASSSTSVASSTPTSSPLPVVARSEEEHPVEKVDEDVKEHPSDDPQSSPQHDQSGRLDHHCHSCYRAFDDGNMLQEHYKASALHPSCAECDVGLPDSHALAEHRLSMHLTFSSEGGPVDDGHESSEEGTLTPQTEAVYGAQAPSPLQQTDSATLESELDDSQQPAAGVRQAADSLVGNHPEDISGNYGGALDVPGERLDTKAHHGDERKTFVGEVALASATLAARIDSPGIVSGQTNGSFIFPIDASTLRPPPSLKIVNEDGVQTDFEDSPTSVDNLSSPPSSFTVSLSPSSEYAEGDEKPVFEGVLDGSSQACAGSESTAISAGSIDCLTPVAGDTRVTIANVLAGHPDTEITESRQTEPTTCVVIATTEEVACQTTPYPSLRCRLCHADPPEDATATMCGHIFCHRCIVNKVIAMPECPCCQTPTLLYCLFRLKLHE